MKNILFKNMTLMLLLLTGFSMPSFAKSTPLNVKVVNENIQKVGDQVSIHLDFVVDDVTVRSNEMIIYTPVIVSALNSNDRTELPSVLLTGNRRNKILKRQQRLNKQVSVVSNPTMSIVKKQKGVEQTIEYAATIDYSDWMRGATLAVETAVSGCADCYDFVGDLLVANSIMPQKEFPVLALTYIEPEVEAIKARADRHTATFNFVVNRYELLREYKNNKPKFDEVDNIIKEITDNNDIEITEFNIAGFASPEGSSPHNKILAEKRADAFANYNYLVTKFNVSKDKFTVESFGEDWNGLRKAVETSTIADKDEILNIIATIDNVDARDEPLKKLSNGTTYRTLLDDFYPQLRRTEYTIAYIVRSFDVEEAKEIIKTNPKLLSLNEMYMVAQSYGVGTPEFKEVFDIAALMYPDSDIAIMNSAAADIENNAINSAINRMNKLSDNPKAWNNLGVAYALKGDLQKALELFDKAANANDTDAIRNLKDLKEYIGDAE